MVMRGLVYTALLGVIFMRSLSVATERKGQREDKVIKT